MASTNRLIFGSCNSQNREQPLWPAILARNASAFIWGGDAVYADKKIAGKHIPATHESIQRAYQKQLENPGYQQLMQQQKHCILGALDDHDYGVNNGGRDFPLKKESGMEFVRFLEQSAQREWPLLAKRASEGKGVYGVVVFDFAREEPLLSDQEAGLDTDAPSVAEDKERAATLSNKSVAVFLLDIRTNKTPWNNGYRDYAGDYNGDFLGEEQWQWFEQGLARSTARVNIVVSGLQVHPDRWFNGALVEDWSRYPVAQHRLYQNLLKPNVKSPILVSGDVHMAELLRRDCQRPNDLQAPSRSLVEVTTSGMTHSWGTFNCPVSQNPICKTTFLQYLHAFSMHLTHINGGWKNLIDYKGPKHEGAKRRVQYSLALNFGEFEFDWEKEQVIVRILGPDSNKPPLLSAKWDFTTLSSGFEPTGKLRPNDFVRRYKTAAKQSPVFQQNDWICLPNAGVMHPVLKVAAPLSAIGIASMIFLCPLVLPIVLLFYFYRCRKVKIE